MEHATTERTTCNFKTCDNDGGTFWIGVTFDEPGLPSIGDGFIGLEFKKNMSMKEADDFTRLLTDTIGKVSITRFR